jgi:hypothetical protein
MLNTTRVRQIEGDASWIVDRERHRIGRCSVETQTQLDTLTGERDHVDRFQSPHLLCLHRQEAHCHREASEADDASAESRPKLPALDGG